MPFKKIKQIIFIIIIIFSLTPLNSSANYTIPEDNIYKTPINYFLKKNIINKGYNNKYSIHKTMTRVNAAKILLLEESHNNEDSSTYTLRTRLNRFISVGESRKLLNKYNKHQALTVGESIKLIYDFYNYPLKTTSRNWKRVYLKKAYTKRMLYMLNHLKVNDKITRGEFILMLYNFHKNLNVKSKAGVVSYYHHTLHGLTTASGIPFNMYDMVAAHKKLPFGTMLKVINPSNGKYVIVEVVDRGPFIPGRVIDLSPAAFEKIAHKGQGLLRSNYVILNSLD